MPEIFTDNLGNTYELGLTFPANTVLNPGITGSVTNNFPNLTPGVTYEFIVVSYAEAGYTGYAGPITVYVVPQSIETLTNIAEITLNLADKNLLVPTLQSEEIKYGHLLYNAAGAFGPVGSFGINVTGYISSIQSELGLFTSNTAYTNYYGSYPYHLVLDYETNITDFINGDKDPRLSTPTGISCALAIADLNTTLALTKQLSPQSVVYEYSCPTLPFFFLFTPGNACSWSGKSTAVTTAEWEAEKARLLEQQSYKISLFENNTDHIDVNAYPTYSDGNTFAGLNAQAGEAWVLNSVDNSIDAISGRKPVQIFTMFSIPEGSEFTLNTMDFNSLRDFTSLISNTQGLGYFKFKPATQSGAKKLFIWWPAKYISNVAAQNTTGSWATDKYIYEARKVLNNLFSDTKTEITSNVYNKPMDDNAAWQTTTIKDAALIAARKKL